MTRFIIYPAILFGLMVAILTFWVYAVRAVPSRCVPVARVASERAKWLINKKHGPGFDYVLDDTGMWYRNKKGEMCRVR